MTSIDDAPADLALAIREFWPPEQWDNAAAIARLESGFNPFASLDTTRGGMVPCGAPISTRGGVVITAERSIGYFQVNACNFPTWDACQFFNVRHNAGTAHMLWAQSGWHPWFFSAQQLGLL